MTTKLNVDYLCVKELLAIFQISKGTFYKYKRTKRLPKPRNVDGKALYDVREFVAAARKNRLKVDPIALELFENQFATTSNEITKT